MIFHRPILYGAAVLCCTLLTPACRNSETKPSQTEAPKALEIPSAATATHKDLVNFTLPETMLSASPPIQGDLYQLLRFATNRFPVKPVFALLQNETLTMGPFDPLVKDLSFLHIAAYKGDAPAWHCSFIFARDRGHTLFTDQDQRIDVSPEADGFQVTLIDGGVFKGLLPLDRDTGVWVEPEQDNGSSAGDAPMRVYMGCYQIEMPDRDRPVKPPEEPTEPPEHE